MNDNETVYESVKGPSIILNKIRKMGIPTEKFEERLMAMDMTAEQFIDYIGYEPDVFLGNVANVKKDIIHSNNFDNIDKTISIPYRVELKIKELKKIIDEEPESLEYRSNTPELKNYKTRMKLVKMKYNFYLRFLKHYKESDNQVLYDKCKEMYDKVLKTVLEMEPVNPKGNSWFIRDELAEISIFIPVHRVDFLNGLGIETEILKKNTLL